MLRVEMAGIWAAIPGALQGAWRPGNGPRRAESGRALAIDHMYK